MEDNSEAPVEQVQKLIGDKAVLVPIRCGSKKPIGKRVRGWQNFTCAKMQEPSYVALLNNGSNIAVLLGKNSGGLVTIDFDDDAAAEEFLTSNPKFRTTLRTKRVRGENVWFKVTGDYPKATKLKTKSGKNIGEFRADGNLTIIRGSAIDRKKGEKEPTDYKIVNNASPIEIAFDEINWSADWVKPWDNDDDVNTDIELLTQQYGRPFYTNENGTPTILNEPYWAGVIAAENILFWEPAERAFYRYNEEIGIYEEISVDAVKLLLSNRLLAASRQMNLQWLEKQRRDSKLTSIVAHLRGVVEKRGAFTKDAKHIHLANGVFSFKHGGELLPFSSEFISRNRSPIAFDENAKCERFLNELVLPAVREDDVRLLQEYVGMCLLGNNIIQRMLILDGESARGKTQFCNVVQGIIGRENVTQLRTKFLGDRFETYRFLRKTLLVGVDVEPDFLSTKGASVLKGLVGGDWFDAEQKGGTGCFPLQGTFCALITSNARLRVRLKGDVAAWRRRLLIVRFEQAAPNKKIPDFGALLVSEEGPGILNWGLGGLHLLFQDMEQTSDIILTNRQRDVVDSLLAESDSLRAFLRERAEKADDCDASVNEIVEAYAAYCPTKGWQALPITIVQGQLQGLMLELFGVTQSHCIKRDNKSVRGFFGVRIKL